MFELALNIPLYLYINIVFYRLCTKEKKAFPQFDKRSKFIKSLNVGSTFLIFEAFAFVSSTFFHIKA